MLEKSCGRVRFAGAITLAVLLLSAFGAVAQAAAPAIVDTSGYWQLVVKVQYGDGKADDITACPSGKVFGTAFEQLLNADQLVQLGVKVDVPGEKTVELAPIDISVNAPPKWQSLVVKTKCNTAIRSIVYTSPMFETSHYLANGTFLVSPIFYHRTKPSGDFVNTAAVVASEAASISTVTAPFADKVGKFTTRTLAGAGTNISQERTLTLAIDPQLGSQHADPAWIIPKAAFGGQYDINLVAQLRKVGSLFNTSAETPPADLVKDNNYFPILAQSFYDDQVATAKTMEGLAQFVAPSSVQDLLTKTGAGEVNNVCGDIDQKLIQVGLSPTDAALVVWALGHKRSVELAEKAAFDSLNCITLNKTLLTAVGVQFKSHSDGDGGGPTKPPSSEEMNATVTRIPIGAPDGQTDLNVFFKGADLAARNQAAARLFVAKPKLSDVNASVFKSTIRTLENTSNWPEELHDPQQPFLTNLGCYAYFDPAKIDLFGGAAMVAVGKTPDRGPAEPGKEVWVVLRFSAVAEGKAAQISDVEIRPSLPPGAREQVLGLHTNKSCGEGANKWNPILLQ